MYIIFHLFFESHISNFIAKIKPIIIRAYGTIIMRNPINDISISRILRYTT